MTPHQYYCACGQIATFEIDEAALAGVAGTVAGDDTIIAVLRNRGAGRALKELLAHAG